MSKVNDMERTDWRMLEQLGEALKAADKTSALDPKLDRLVAATLAHAAEVVAESDVAAMTEGANLAHRFIGMLTRHHGAERGSSSYLAGRLAALADLLGYAAEHGVDARFLADLAAPRFAQVLQALRGGARSNAQLAGALRQSQAHVCRVLKDLRQMGAVTSHQRGREMYNDLAPVTRAWLNQTAPVVEAAPARTTRRAGKPVQPATPLPRLMPNLSHPASTQHLAA